jgi:hypothetical protein
MNWSKSSYLEGCSSMKQPGFSNLLVLFLFLFGSAMAYQFGRSAIWFISGAMFLFPSIIARIKGEMNYTDCLQDFIAGLALTITGGIQIGSGMTVQSLFLSYSNCTLYHLTVHSIWMLALLGITLLDFIGTGGNWNFSKLLTSFARSCRMLLLCISLSILIQVQHPSSISR